MKEAIGYTTDDGKFFESMDEAEEHEAWQALTYALSEVAMTRNSTDVDIFMTTLAAIPNEIRRYINANEAATRSREIQASLSAEDHSLGETNPQAILEQQTRIDEPLSNMGSGVIEETIRQQRAIDGIGSGRTDASNVRSSENLATGTYTKPTKARLNSSTSHLR